MEGLCLFCGVINIKVGRSTRAMSWLASHNEVIVILSFGCKKEGPNNPV